jgi:hypothetical protein
LAFKVTNLFVLAAWFVAQHHLQAVSSSLTVALTIALAFTTGNYRIDDSFVIGRTGAPLDVVRSESFFRLALLGRDAAVPTLVNLIETILYGEAQEHSIEATAEGVPSTSNLIKEHMPWRALKSYQKGWSTSVSHQHRTNYVGVGLWSTSWALL